MNEEAEKDDPLPTYSEGWLDTVNWKSPLINVGRWAADNVTHVGPDYFKNYDNPDECTLSRVFGIEPELAKELERVCHHSNYIGSANVTVEPFCQGYYGDRLEAIDNEVKSKNIALRTLSGRMERLKQRKPLKDQIPIRQVLYSSNNISQAQNVTFKGLEKEVVLPEVILTVTLMRHQRFKTGSNIVVDREFEVLGRQSLSLLKEMILCKFDIQRMGEVSDNPEETVSRPKGQDLYPSSFIFIEGVFYQDICSSSPKDMVNTIINWSNSFKTDWSNLEVKGLHTTTFDQLNIVLGKPYLFCHIGSCEHVFFFKDLRFYHPDDKKYFTDYPNLITKGISLRTLCCVCYSLTSSWMTVDDDIAPSSPAYYCDRCMEEMHYVKSKPLKKVAPFKLYQYIDQSMYS